VDLDQIRNWIIENVLKMVDFQEMIMEKEAKEAEYQQNDEEI